MEKALSERLLTWYDRYGRTLPFRGTKDPYRIWVSEIMLQQTRTETAGAYFLRFMERFPTVFDLAKAPQQDVLKMWEGLGYYSRARNLHKAAGKVAEEWGGIFPADYDKMLSLPGVGEYTAAAIASIAFDLPCPAMDGNLTRVLSRVHGVREDVGIPSVKRKLLSLAKKDMPDRRCGDFNQALMDLGASHCCPGTPECDKCPLFGLCDARKEGDAEYLPVKAVQKPPVEMELAAVVVTCKGEALLLQRKEALLKNLWVYPLLEDAEGEEQVKEGLEKMGLMPVKLTKHGQARHVFTHRIWQMQLWHCEVKQKGPGQWFSLAGMQNLPIPTAVKAARQLAERVLTKEIAFVSLNECPEKITEAAKAYQASWQDAHRAHASKAFLEEHTPLFMEMLLRSHISTGKMVYAVCTEGKAVGVLVLDAAENELCTLYIHPAYQRQGIGTKATAFAIEKLNREKEMFVTALDQAPHAVKMYKNAGFVQVKEHRLLNKTYDLWETSLIRPGEKEEGGQ